MDDIHFTTNFVELQTSIPELKGSENYDEWRVNILFALRVKNAMKIVVGRETKPENPELEQTSSSPSSSFDKDKVKARDLHREIEEYERSLASWTTRDNYAVGLIGATVSNVIQRRYLNPETQTAREMWLALEKNFQTRSLILVYHHRKRLKDFSWNNDASIRSNIDGFMSIVMDLRALGHVITEVDQAMDLIMRLPQTTRWGSVVNQLLIMLPQSKDDLTTFDGAGNKVTFSFELIEKRIMEEAFQTTFASPI